MSSSPTNDAEMLDDYSAILQQQQPRPNRFAANAAEAKRFVVLSDGSRQEIRTVQLDEDVAAFFATSESINTVLRAILHSLPNAA